ncbi:MAG TPA: hypothetical protein VEX66_01280 [Microlunatus sp.]|nr:hypothetical protein [Microlunatus sp.]
MSRRVKLPGASELFRPTGTETPVPRRSEGERIAQAVRPVEDVPAPAPTIPPAPAGGTGRVRHDEKITVYVSRDELLALEQARLRLRGELGLAVDRGRLVRAAIAYALSDLESAGEDGEMVRRLTAS